MISIPYDTAISWIGYNADRLVLYIPFYDLSGISVEAYPSTSLVGTQVSCRSGLTLPPGSDFPLLVFFQSFTLPDHFSF